MADRPDDAARAAGAITDFTPMVTAVITTTDEDAAALIACLQAGGRRVPEDVSVCSLGDLPVATVVSPALTTVRLPLRESGRVGMSRARDALDGAGPGTPTELPVELVVRDSTGPVPV
jgi:DNA-binding LacI/PurR family transcriptional regulator